MKILELSQNKRKIGNISEAIARNYLVKKGYKIIESNHYQRSGEIDIIATENKIIVFVEVKSLKSENFLQITETISALKKRRLCKLANLWLFNNNKQGNEFRIDFIGLVYKFNKIRKLVHLRNAIY